MNPQLTPQQALDLLYSASRMAAMPANDHEAVAQAAKVLANALAPKPETTSGRVDSPGECGGDVAMPDGRKRRKKSG